MANLNSILEGLSSKAYAWAHLSLEERIPYLDAILDQIDQADRASWAAASCKVQGLGTGCDEKYYNEAFAGDAIVVSVALASKVKGYKTLYKEVSQGKLQKIETRVTKDGRTAAKIMPIKFGDKTSPLLAGNTVEVWLKDGTTEAVREFPDPPINGKVCAVLGAGNQTFLSLTDVLDRMFLHSEVVCLKHHELRSYSSPHVAFVYQKLIADGYMAEFSGDGAQGAALVAHPLVGHVHITGGVGTFNKIVWGKTPSEQEANKKAGTPVLKKSITAELGNVTPWVIVPGGEWKDSDLSHHAEQICGAFTGNNSCNCMTPRVVIMSKTWQHRERFMHHFRTHLAKEKCNPPYYPGTGDRYRRFLEQYPDAEVVKTELSMPPNSQGQLLAEPGQRVLDEQTPWALVHKDLSAVKSDEYGFQTEAFAPILFFLTLPEENSDEFARAAVKVCNEKLCGTLCAILVVHPDVEKSHPSLVDELVGKLEYGMIGLNCWLHSAYIIDRFPWGGWGHETLRDCKSGVGFVSNSLCIQNIEKSFLRTDFVSPGHFKRNLSPPTEIATVLGGLMARPSFLNFTRLFRTMLSLVFSGVLKALGFKTLKAGS